MPMDRRLYPANWDEIARAIKDTANWQCENCGRPCRRPGESWMEFCDRVRTTRLSECPVVADVLYKPTRYTLTVAHLNHRPEDCRPENLRAWCSVCHCRYDLAAMAEKRRIRAERNGQLTLGV